MSGAVLARINAWTAAVYSHAWDGSETLKITRIATCRAMSVAKLTNRNSLPRAKGIESLLAVAAAITSA